MKTKESIIAILLLVQTVYCWWCFFEAKVLPYDDNYGILIHSIIISMAAWVILRIFIAKWFGQFQLNKKVFWSWVAVGSPLTFILGFFFYSDLFGSLAT
jgi:hypothetical protein